MSDIAMRIRNYLRNISGQGVSENALQEELDAYVALAAEERVRAGEDPAAALRNARMQLGGQDNVAERVREARSGYGTTGVLQDARHTLRMLRRNPGYSAAIILTLALGIGATTAIFSVVRSVLLRQLPYESPDQLVRVWPSNPQQNIPQGAIAWEEVQDWRNETSVFSRFSAYNASMSGLGLSGNGEPVRLTTAYIFPDFFETLGVRAMVGRTPTEKEYEDGSNHVAVLSYDLWQTRFGGDRGLIGRTLTLNEQPFTVIGVMSPEMRFPNASVQIYAPASVMQPHSIPRNRSARWLQMVGRLAPGVTQAEAQRRLSMLTQRLEKDHAESNAGWSTASVASLRDSIIGPARGRLAVMFSTVMLIMLLGCVNIANLILARATQRSREIAVRAAIGASRARIIRQLMTESLVLSAIGGALGLALAWAGSSTLASMSAAWLTLPPDAHPDWMVLLFAMGISIVTGIAFGLIPAMNGFGAVSGTLREHARGSSPNARSHALRRVFVAVQLALAVMLVTAAGLFLQSFARLNNVDLGFDAERIAFARMTLPDGAAQTKEMRFAAGERMMAAVAAMPGVTEVAVIKHPPLRGEPEPLNVTVPGMVYAAGTEPVAGTTYVSPGYFHMMGIPMRAGRDFTPQDEQGTGVVVLSASVARTLFGDRDPVGRNIMIGDETVPVIGVVNDAHYMSVDGPATPMMYVTRHMMTRSVITVMARGTLPPDQLAAAIRDGVRSVAPDQPITELSTMHTVVARALAAPRFLTLMLTMFGALALLLAAIGVYGVVSYVVGQRRNEIGIRMALGARASEIVGLTIRTGMAPVVVGLAGGIVAAGVLARLIRSQLFDTGAGDPATYAAVVALLAFISLVATSIPAMRAARVDPTTALRNET